MDKKLPNKNRVTGRKSNKDFRKLNFVLLIIVQDHEWCSNWKRAIEKILFSENKKKNAKYFEKLFDKNTNYNSKGEKE